MTVTPTSFRADFPEFVDTDVYPDSGVTFWLDLAILALPADRWAEFLDLGTELYTAHNIALEAQAQATAAAGGIPGQAAGVIASKTVDKLTIAYDTQAAIEEGGGEFNLTLYGRRFLRLVRMFGSGGVQL